MNEKCDIEKMGLYIAKRRKELHLTQKQLGDILDRSDKTISKWERGTVAPDITLLVPLSVALKTTVTDILSGGEKEKKQTPDDLTVSGIKLYTKMEKKKLSKIFMSLLIIIIAFFGTALFFNNYYKWQVYDITSSNKDYFINSYISENKESMKFVVNSLTYLSDDIGTETEPWVNSLQFMFDSDGKTLYSNDISFNDYLQLHSALDLTHLFFESDKKVKLNKENMSLIIRFFDKNEKENIIKIPLKYK